MTRFVLTALLASLSFGGAAAQAQDLTISFPSARPYYTPYSATTISFPSNAGLTVAVPWQPPIQVGGSGLVVSEHPYGGMTIDMPGQPPVDLNPGNFAVLDLYGSTGTTIDFPAWSAPILVFPYSSRAPVALGDSTGLTLTNYGYWEALPRIEMPGGGGLVANLPSGATPPIDLNPGAGLTVEIPKGDTKTFWFYQESPVWYGWY